MKVTFPDGFGESYTYDMFGRRMTKSQFNHEGSIQETTEYHYKGDTYVITDEKDASGETVTAYTFSDTGRPLSITYNGETFWYVYNGHGDVTALTDKDGKIAARYEYDAWGLVTRMYNRFGQRVREGIGWMGDLGTGNGSPGSAFRLFDQKYEVCMERRSIEQRGQTIWQRAWQRTADGSRQQRCAEDHGQNHPRAEEVRSQATEEKEEERGEGAL